MGRDFYAILGVQRSATEAELKKAYRKKALRWHPDKHSKASEAKRAEAESKFKDVNEAYSVLSDGNKKAIYDQYGEEGLQGVPAGGESKDGNFGHFGNMGGGGGSQTFFFSSNGGGVGGDGGFGNAHDIFREFFGTSNPFEAQGDDPMSGFGFGGLRGFPDVHAHPPQRQQTRRQQPQKRQAQFECTLEQLYSGCKKRMRVTRDADESKDGENILEIDVRPGWKEGTKITFPEAQDIQFVLKERQHSRFHRRGNDLVFKAAVTLEEALVGTNVTIITLDDRVLEVSTLDDVITPGFTKVVRGEGMPISKSRNGARGDLVVEFDISFPRKLSRRQKMKISAAFADEG